MSALQLPLSGSHGPSHYPKMIELRHCFPERGVSLAADGAHNEEPGGVIEI
jgi:hypothetical protein